MRSPVFSNSTDSANAQAFMTAPQCKCKDIKDCSHKLESMTNKCKVSDKCGIFLKKIGNPAKIRECLSHEQAEMDRLEECVEKKVGPVGCTDDEHPKNLTIPIMSFGSPASTNGASGRRKRATKNQSQTKSQQQQQQEVGHAPMELSDYLMCVDECAMKELENEAKTCTARQTSCAIKLRCTLAPSEQKDQIAFEECEKSLGLEPERRFKQSCQCLKSSGIQIQCPN